MGFSCASSRALPQGKHTVATAKPREYKKDRSDEVTCRSLERVAVRTRAERPRVFLDIDIGGRRIGRVVCELYSDIVPRTAENFRLLCTGEKGLGIAGKPLHYKGCPFHRVVPGFALQGGDITKGDGSGGESAYGYLLDDEAFDLRHGSPGLLTMANRGPNSNSSQFLILLKASPALDQKHVVFGHVVEGMEIVRRVEAACGVADSGRKDFGSANGPTPSAHEVVAFRDIEAAYVSDCGELLGGAEEVGGAKAPAKRPRTEDGSEQAHVFHILKKHAGLRWRQTWRGSEATCTKAKAKIALEGLRKRLVASAVIQRTFAELAREHSDAASSQQGGDLGCVGRADLDDGIAEVAFALEKGGLSDVFETAEGLHLVLRAP